MNLAEFSTELGKLADRSMMEGVALRKMTLIDVVGVIELQKLEIVRGLQDMARAHAAKQNEIRIHLPPGGKFQ
jgi:hypothetical protein